MLSFSNVRVGQQHGIARRVASARKAAPFRVGAGFVDEDEALRVKIDLPFEPILTRGIYIAAPLLGSVRCLFKCDLSALEETPKRSNAGDIPGRFNRSRNSASVISGFTATASKINCEYVLMRCDLRSPPWRLGTMSPASLRRPRQRIALAPLTPKCSAACRQDKPPLFPVRDRHPDGPKPHWRVRWRQQQPPE
ncbi:hypothetical protein J2S34_003654 [Nitrobacter winogradskyi]|uniref:Uncharacterized protein n=1 Tax=Nitrobacter winogradskyi TaxID=913 RepID=A0ACC6ANW1_NITWI|nr:hypothetical protein [Nitrobacter winogradskyi]